jgi:hypothetical protein
MIQAYDSIDRKFWVDAQNSRGDRDQSGAQGPYK